ncbi:MAG TPA: mandelate racemase/muconate lactonizing enzyme family protein [Alphaproteobacteria bacterium]|nr:mandelate racemase/muconate lactonizing enzyme family protein [Alphaproteobacteria bacterium]
MKIADIRSHLVRLPYTTGSSGQWGDMMKWTTFDYVLLRVETEDGIVGWGDAFGYGAAMATKAAVDHIVAPGAIGMDARDIKGISHTLQQRHHLWGRHGVTLFAIGGLDIALWDIAGKAAGLPLHRLLGGPRRLEIPAYASLFKYQDPELVAERTRAALADGFGLIKLHETGEAEVAAAREAAGDDVPIMIDTNCPWTPHQAREMALRFKAYDPYWLEEPIFPPEDYASLARLQAETGVPLAAGENACGAVEFQKMVEADAVSFLQPSVTKVGGVSEFLKIIALAEAQGATVMPHCPYFGPGLLASLHLLSLLPDEALAEFFYYQTLEASLYGDAIRPVNGVMRVPTGPGLGLDPDPDVIRDYAAKD